MATPLSSKLLFWPRWFWRQLTSMRTALFLLLLLALAAVPGSVYPQRSADPNGVRLYFNEQPELAQLLDALQLFDVYTSVWFSSIYILLFISLIGCVLPRTKVHWDAMLAKPVQTPKNLERMSAYLKISGPANTPEVAERTLKSMGFRTQLQANSVSAERGYIKETGNLIFHYSLIGVLLAVGIGGGFSYSGQRLLVEGEVFVNNLASYDAFSPGPLFFEEELQTYSIRLDKFEVVYDLQNLANRGQPIDFIATITKTIDGQEIQDQLRVNYPLAVPGANVYLTGNGFAPVITLRDGNGNIAFSGAVPFLPQDSNMTSLGVIKAPDALPVQIGIIAFFYPTAEQLESGAYTSIYPDPFIPLMTMNVYTGDLGLDAGIPRNVYALDTSEMELVAGRDGPNPPLMLEVGDTVSLPDGLGSVSFDGLRRFASFDIAYNPGGIWVLGLSLVALFSVMVSLLVPRRRVWVRANPDGTIELAALARGDDPKLEMFLDDFRKKLESEITK